MSSALSVALSPPVVVSSLELMVVCGLIEVARYKESVCA